jgi:hypothetical protein
MIFHAGVAHGIALAVNTADNGQTTTIYEAGPGNPYGYPHIYWHPPLGFLPFGGVIGLILFIFLVIGLFRMAFFHPWHMEWTHPDPWHGPQSHPWGGQSPLRQQDTEKEGKTTTKK